MNRRLILVLVVLGLAAAVIFPRLFLRESRRVGTRSVDTLETIKAAQAIYARTHPGRGFASSLAELGPGPGAQLIDSVLASGRKSGYVYSLNTTPPDSSGRIAHYTVIVRPEKYGPESPSFFIDETGVERFTVENRAPTVNDPLRPVQ
jgi:type II secretory pathway pseudopilin PulG